MNRQRGYQSRAQSKSSGIEVSGVLQRRGAVRSASVQRKQSEEDTNNHSWTESPLVKNFKPVPVRSPFLPQPFPQRAPTETPSASEGEGVIQSKGEMTENSQISSEVSRPNKTGLPDGLKKGIETLSGYSMDDVKVHYNSDKPAQLNALAYTQGTQIHMGPGQEQYLPHEGWHVVQQKQGRVKATMQAYGVSVNADSALEQEADVMGNLAQKAALSSESKAISIPTSPQPLKETLQRQKYSSSVIQRMVGINSDNIKEEIKGLISKQEDQEKWTKALTEAYTLVQHISWAHNIVGGKVFDMSSPEFNTIGKNENLILVAHGEEGSSGGFNGATIARFLAHSKTGLPNNWEGSVYITSCNSGSGDPPLVEDVTKELTKLGKSGITVTGYAGVTVTHKQFNQFFFVVNPEKQTKFDEISSDLEKKEEYQLLFLEWWKGMQGLLSKDIIEMGDYTSDLTAKAYREMIKQAAEKDVFLDKAHAEVSRTSQ